MSIAESTVPISDSTIISSSDLALNIEVPPPPPISLSDILNDTQVLQRKEVADKAILESIGQISYEELRKKLVEWALRGFPNVYPINEVAVSAPPVCSDGEVRTLQDYILYCSGKTLQQHIEVLQQRVADITVSFSYTGFSIQIVVSKDESS